MDKRQLKKGLKQIAVGIATTNGLDMSRDSRLLIYQMINKGVDRLAKEQDIDNYAVKNAQQDIILLVSEMARFTITSGRGYVQETSFFKIRDMFCPMPPWFPGPC